MNTPHQNPPDEQEIAELLSRFKPHPTQRFYQRMEAAPWRTSIHSDITSTFERRKPSPRLVWSLVVLLVIILVGTIVFIPPVRAIAKQIIFSFLAAPSNQIEVQVTLSSPCDLFNFSDPSNFHLSVDEVRQLVDFPVLVISATPDGLKLIGARYDPIYNTVILLYQGEQYTLFLTQRQLGNSQDVFSIGSDATVKLVKIGDIQAEYVQGGWKAISTASPTNHQTPESQVSITAIWDNNLPQSTLRWQAGNMAYELRTIGKGSPSQSELIKWANELK